MADYFAALAARTLRPELSVQPRQRVRWEESVEPDVRSVPVSAQPLLESRRPSAFDTPEPSRTRAQSPAEPSEPPGAQIQSRSGRQARTRKVDRKHDEASEAIPMPHPTVRDLEPVVQVRSERVVIRPDEAPVKSAARDRAATPASIVGVERARPVATRASKSSRAAEPVIRIHIGRVDVRAVTSAGQSSSAPAAQRDARRALMSIDEYVQKRDRGAS